MDQARNKAQNGDCKKELPCKTAVYEHVQKYAKPCSWTATWWLIQTMALWGVLNASVFYCPNYWMATIIAGLMSLVRLRLFILYHDMGHNSFFGTDKLNQRVGYVVGSFVLGHSFSYWVRGHNYHHKNANNLDKKLFAQTAPWSIEQYQKAAGWQRMLYTTVYGWPFLFTACPLYFILLQFLVCSWAELLGIVCTWSFAIWMGPVYLYCRAVSTVVAAALGIIFFHVQHTFDNPYRRHNHNWDYFETAMKGSSFFMIPRWFRYWTCGIEYHHVHHINSRVPSYRLAKCHDLGLNYFTDVPRVRPSQVWRGLRYSLYDELRNAFVALMPLDLFP